MKKKTYQVTYRGELEVIIETNSETEALIKAEKSEKWRFILDPHPDFLELTDITNELKEDKWCIKCGKKDGLLDNEDMCYTCAKERGRI